MGGWTHNGNVFQQNKKTVVCLYLFIRDTRNPTTRKEKMEKWKGNESVIIFRSPPPTTFLLLLFFFYSFHYLKNLFTHPAAFSFYQNKTSICFFLVIVCYFAIISFFSLYLLSSLLLPSS